jgi:hypothetical protein
MGKIRSLAPFRPPAPPERWDRRDESVFRQDLERAFHALQDQLKSAGILATVDADTTPSVDRGRVFSVANTGATSITAFDNAEVGQIYTFIFADANTTVVDGANLHLAGGANFVSSADDVLTLVWDGTHWYEVSRSVN